MKNKNIFWQNVWKDTKKEFGTIWRTKKKWMIPIWLLITTLFIFLEATTGWQTILSSLFVLVFILPLVIFASFYTPTLFQLNSELTKKWTGIAKKARINSPEKYGKVKIIRNLIIFIFFLELLFACLLGFLVNDKLRILVVFICLLSWLLSYTAYAALILFCREIGKEKPAEQERLEKEKEEN